MSLARLLAWGAVLLWSGAAGLAWVLVHWGVPVWVAIVIAVLMGPASQGGLLAIEFITGALIDRRPGPRLSPGVALRLWACETWAWWRMFAWHMPFRASFAEPLITHDPQRRAVLLIHGYLCNRAVWKPLLDSGALSHCNLATINLESVFGSIDAHAEPIHRAVEALRIKSGASHVTLVCHSMGGLAARAYLRQYGDGAINHVITLATPHAGTVFAHCGHGINARQMRPGSDYLKQLATDTAPYATRLTCIGSIDDNLIVPRTSVWLPGAQPIKVECVGHLALLCSSEAQQRLALAVDMPIIA